MKIRIYFRVTKFWRICVKSLPFTPEAQTAVELLGLEYEIGN
jgi:hypothetical protein